MSTIHEDAIFETKQTKFEIHSKKLNLNFNVHIQVLNKFLI